MNWENLGTILAPILGMAIWTWIDDLVTRRRAARADDARRDECAKQTLLLGGERGGRGGDDAAQGPIYLPRLSNRSDDSV